MRHLLLSQWPHRQMSRSKDQHTNDVMGWHADGELMQGTREQENQDLRNDRGDAASAQRAINVPTHKASDRLVPCNPVDTDAWGVPPFGVELAVSEAHDFSKGIQEGVEESHKAGQPAKEGNGGEFQHALDNGDEVKRRDLVQRVLQQRRGVLSGSNPDDDAETEHFAAAFEDKRPADLISAGVDGLIDQRRSPPEIRQILE